MDSAAFYDDYLSVQVESGINDRIIGLFRRMKKLGLTSQTSVLEIGCGIGTLTYLLLRKIKTGKIEGIDISSKSIHYAKNHLKASNLSLTASNVLQYNPEMKCFDRILLFDVLEHIPLDQHSAVFERISKWMHNKSKLLINIPNPGYILYDQKNNPAALQETDQPVHIHPLSKHLQDSSLEIQQLETYSVWVKDDYQFMVIRKRSEFLESILSDDRNFFQKGVVWMKRKWWKMKYPYPPKR